MDSYGSEIVADLLETYGFDFQAWLRGDVNGTPLYVLSLISLLPEGSRYAKRYHFDHREELAEARKESPADAEYDAWLDSQYWDGDRMLLAQAINAIRELTMVAGAGKWKKGKEPKYPLVGPEEWRNSDSKNPTDKKAPVSDRLHKFFFGG